MDGWGVICTNSVYMVLLWFYIRGWVKGMDQGMDHAYATDKTQNEALRRKPRTFYKVDEQIPLG